MPYIFDHPETCDQNVEHTKNIMMFTVPKELNVIIHSLKNMNTEIQR